MKRFFSTGLFVLAGIFLLTVSCQKDKELAPEGGKDIKAFPVALTEADYNSENTYYLLNDNESPDVFLMPASGAFMLLSRCKSRWTTSTTFNSVFTVPGL